LHGLSKWGQSIEVTNYFKLKRPIFDVEIKWASNLLDTPKTNLVQMGYEEISKPMVRTIDPTLGAKLGREVLDNALPFAVDVGFQLVQDWNNPRLTFGRRVFRAGTAGFVGLAGGAIVAPVLTAIGAPVSIPTVLIGGLIIGLTIETPVTTWIYNNVPFLGELPRNLSPLE
jgi:hypothetical protein